MILSKRNLTASFIDLYAGAGGMSLGMIQAGMKCVAAVEIDPWAAATYWVNLCYHGFSTLNTDANDKNEKLMKALSGKPDTLNWLFPEPPDEYWTSDPEPSPTLSLWMRDILTLEPEEIMTKYDFAPGELSCIVGGPPCQGFSWINSKRHMADKRNEHPFRFIYFVEQFKPKYFLIENVPGILSLGRKKGDKEGPFPVWIREAADKAGYNLTYDVHNAAHYGVPQNRNRVLFFGVRKDLGNKELKLTPTHTYDYFEQKNKRELFAPEGEPFVTVFEAIGDLSDMMMGAMRKSDAKKLPFGSKQRFVSDTDSMVEYNGQYFQPDSFNGVYLPAGKKGDSFEKRGKEDHKICSNCGKYNLKVRKHCHFCRSIF